MKTLEGQIGDDVTEFYDRKIEEQNETFEIKL